jgi:type VI secretion system protein ImpC
MQQEVILQDLCIKANIDLMSAPKMFNLAQYSDHNTLIDIPSNERTLAAIGVLLDQVTDDSPSINKVDKALIDHYISRIDEKMSEQLDAIMHHQDFQSLEARWRGLDYLLTHSDPSANVKVELIDVSKEDLLADFEDAPDTTHSGLYQHVYTQEYDTPGGEPFSVLISDYEFDKTPQDIALLRELSKVSSASHCPFISNIGAQFFDKHNFDEVMKIKDMKSYMEKAEYIRWQSFRKTEDARYIGLVMPKFLLRLPYGDETEKVKSFGYRESVVLDQHKRYLWGAASFAFAANMARSFKKHGWTLNVRGPESGGKLEFLPLHQYDLGSGIQTKIPTEISIPETREVMFAELGFVPLSYYKKTYFACFFSENSAKYPQKYDDELATANSRINVRLPYVLLVSRLAHYMKVIQRENIGSSKNAQALQGEMIKWITRLVTKSENPTPETIAKYPLSEAAVSVQSIPENPGYYSVQLNVVPHFQIEGMDITLSLVSQLPQGQ